MRFDSVNFEKRGKVAVVTLDEPSKLNALSAGVRRGVAASLAQIEADDEIRVAVITGSGDKAFCAGGDISEFSFEAAQVRRFKRDIFFFLQSPERCSKPIIAAVNGFAFGGGFELAISCDFILCSDRAKLGVPEIKLGLLPGFAIVRLQELVGRPKAKELTMLGEPISAEEACRIGLALKVVSHDKLMDEAMKLAETIASRPRHAVAMAKSSYNRGLGGDDVYYSLESTPFLFLTEDTKEGVTAFLEKRVPRFKD